MHEVHLEREQLAFDRPLDMVPDVVDLSHSNESPRSCTSPRYAVSAVLERS